MTQHDDQPIGPAPAPRLVIHAVVSEDPLRESIVGVPPVRPGQCPPGRAHRPRRPWTGPRLMRALRVQAG